MSSGLRMDWRAECIAVIPCLDEEASVGPLVAAVRRYLPTVLVVDDGSRDNTSSIAEGSGAEVLRHQTPQGKGAALQAGWRRALEGGFKWALTLDGDGQHSPEDIPSFLECAERTATVLVVGNRMGEAERMPPLRRFVNRWMSRRLSKAAGRLLPDSQCGFRLMNLGALTKLTFSSRHFEIESELLMAFIAAGQPVEFVPIRVIYQDERTKIRPLRDTLRWFWWWGRRKIE